MGPPELTRRDLLRVTGLTMGGLSGCVTGDGGGTPTNSAPPASATPTETVSRTASPTPTEVRPEEMETSVEVIEQATEDHPARFRVALRNVGSRTVLVQYGGTGLVSDLRAENESGTGRLNVFPRDTEHLALEDSDGRHIEDPIPDSRVDGCWRTPRHEAMMVNAIALLGPIEPGEATVDEYVILNDGNDACFPVGEYEAGNTITAWPGMSAREREEGALLLLRFTITIGEDRTVQVSNSTVEPATERIRGL